MFRHDNAPFGEVTETNDDIVDTTDDIQNTFALDERIDTIDTVNNLDSYLKEVNVQSAAKLDQVCFVGIQLAIRSVLKGLYHSSGFCSPRLPRSW